MIFEYRNIGPIRDVKITLDKDLTFVYGKNSIGKSYAITLSYLILKNFLSITPLIRRYFINYLSYGNSETNDFIRNISNKLENSTNYVDITFEINSFIEQSFSDIFLSSLEESILSSYGAIDNLNNKLSNEKFEIILHFDTYSIIITEKENHLGLDFKYKDIICKKSQRHLLPKNEQDFVKFYFTDDLDILKNDIIQFSFNIVRRSIFEIGSNISNVYFLPASRSGLYRALNAFSQILAELSKKRTFLHQKIILPSISEQDSDYFSMLNEINLKKVNETYNEIAKDIESDLLKGTVSFDQKTKQILFHPQNSQLDLELLGTSSMIAEISPLVLFLRYIISGDEDKRKTDNAKPIIFIEEPEAHLHPENQVKLTEFFADIVKAGAKIVITSHSNYIFSKLNNLIANNTLGTSEVEGILLQNFEGGSISEIINQGRFGLEDKNFVDISEVLYKEKMEIIKKL